MAIEIQDANVTQGIITLAFGKPRYLEMAKLLARSLQLHAPLVPRAIVTDSSDSELHGLFNDVIPYRPEFGSNVRQKLHLDLYSPFSKTLFIDSDCLVLGNLDSFWQAFAGQYFGVCGSRVLRRGESDAYLDVAATLDRFALDGLPKFNGGVYYFTRSEETNLFFDVARKLLADSGNLPFRQFRSDGPSDEAIFSVAMALKGLPMTSMGIGGMWTPIESKGPFTLDVMRGFCSFQKEGGRVLPEIVHFAGEYASCLPYCRESMKLKHHFKGPRTPLATIARSYLKAVLWQLSRSSRTFAKTLLTTGRPARVTS